MTPDQADRVIALLERIADKVAPKIGPVGPAHLLPKEFWPVTYRLRHPDNPDEFVDVHSPVGDVPEGAEVLDRHPELVTVAQRWRWEDGRIHTQYDTRSAKEFADQIKARER